MSNRLTYQEFRKRIHTKKLNQISQENGLKKNIEVCLFETYEFN